MAAYQTEVSSEDEILLKVPEELVLVPVGFALDAGGSVTKLLYRSKDDYKNGKRIEKTESDEGLLRMRYFRSGSDEELISFIRDHCDVMKSASDADGWFHTGVQTQRFKERLEEVLRTKVKTISEPDAVYKALYGFYSRVPSCRPLGFAPAAVDRALESVRGMLELIHGFQQLGDANFDHFKTEVDPQFIVDYTTKVMTADGATWAQELSQDEIEWPCLGVICGSADAMMVFSGDGKYGVGNFSGVSGKTFLSLGKALCGAKDFDELIEMAGRGDHTKVDIMSGDMKVKGRKEIDWYTVMPENFVIFTLGKLEEEPYKGTYTKEDMAAGLLHMVVSIIAKIASATARLTKAKSVVFTGSFVSRQLVMEAMQQWVLEESLLQPVVGEEQLKWVFVPYPGFICSLGAWYRNWELEQERIKK